MATKSTWLKAALLLVFCFYIGAGAAFAAMEIPEKLKEAPLYSGSKIVQVMDMENNAMAMMTVKADRDELLGFYKKSMKDKGWKVTFQAEQEDSAVIHFTKESQVIQVTVQKGDEEGMLQYQLVAMSQ